MSFTSRLLVIIALSGLIGFTLAAHADTVTYTYTGGFIFPGTSFTYVDTAGFLAFDTGKLTPTTSTDLIDIFSGDIGPLTAFEFVSSTDYHLYAGDQEVVIAPPPYAINAAVIGEDLEAGSTLTITDTPTVSSVPEPSSLILLGTGVLSTGVLGLAGAARRRFLTA